MTWICRCTKLLICFNLLVNWLLTRQPFPKRACEGWAEVTPNMRLRRMRAKLAGYCVTKVTFTAFYCATSKVNWRTKSRKTVTLLFLLSMSSHLMSKIQFSNTRKAWGNSRFWVFKQSRFLYLRSAWGLQQLKLHRGQNRPRTTWGRICNPHPSVD